MSRSTKSSQAALASADTAELVPTHALTSPVPSGTDRIRTAIGKAGHGTGDFSEGVARRLTMRLLNTFIHAASEAPRVEEIQDIVEDVLLASPFKKTAKSHILYRGQHAQIQASCRPSGLGWLTTRRSVTARYRRGPTPLCPKERTHASRHPRSLCSPPIADTPRWFVPVQAPLGNHLGAVETGRRETVARIRKLRAGDNAL